MSSRGPRERLRDAARRTAVCHHGCCCLDQVSGGLGHSRAPVSLRGREVPLDAVGRCPALENVGGVVGLRIRAHEQWSPTVTDPMLRDRCQRLLLCRVPLQLSGYHHTTVVELRSSTIKRPLARVPVTGCTQSNPSICNVTRARRLFQRPLVGDLGACIRRTRYTATALPINEFCVPTTLLNIGQSRGTTLSRCGVQINSAGAEEEARCTSAPHACTGSLLKSAPKHS